MWKTLFLMYGRDLAVAHGTVVSKTTQWLYTDWHSEIFSMKLSHTSRYYH